MNLIAGEYLKRGDKLTVNHENKAIKLKIGSVYIGIACKNTNIGESVEIIREIKKGNKNE